MIYKLFIFIGYIMPYGFLSIYGDYKYGSMLGYLIMMIILAFLFYILNRNKDRIIIVLGNILNLISSLVILKNISPLDWEYYFKPLSPLTIIILLNIIGILIQYIIYKKMNKNDN